jgi:hypothetical protein
MYAAICSSELAFMQPDKNSMPTKIAIVRIIRRREGGGERAPMLITIRKP